MLAAVLAPLGFVELLLVLRRASRRGTWPDSPEVPLLLAGVACGVHVALSSELLGLLGLFDRAGIVLSWAALDLALAPFALRAAREERGAPDRAPAPRTFPDLLFLAALVTWLLLLPLVFFVAQTNFDAHTYHLPRVMAWLQQGSLDPFPTNDYRRLDLGPFGSMAVAHLYALGAGDRLVGLAQWLAMGGALLSAASLTHRLLAGATAVDGSLRRRAAGIAMLFTATLPVLLVQSTTCQNDLTGAAWLAAAVALGAHLLARPDLLPLAIGSSAAFALAVLTKETTALAGAPFAAFGTLALAARAGRLRERIAWPSALALAVALLFSGPLLRRASVFGSPLGSSSGREAVVSTDRSPAAVVSGVLRGASLYGATGIRPLTDALAGGIARLHRLTGRPLDDPATTLPGTRFRFQGDVFVNDSFANTPWSLVVLVLACALLPGRRVPARARLAAFGGLVALGALILAGGLRWNEQVVRYHLSCWILVAPLVGIVLAAVLPRALQLALAAVLLGNGLFALATNETRPLLPTSRLLDRPREEQLFATVPEVYPAYRLLATGLANLNCREVGLNLGFLELEYPLWALLGGAGGPFRIHYTAPDSLVRPKSGALPCAVVTSPVGLPDDRFAVLEGDERAAAPDIVPFGHLRLHVSPDASSRWRLTLPGPGGFLEDATAGRRFVARGRSGDLLLWTYRPGVFELELEREGPSAAGAGDGLKVRTVDGRELPMTFPAGLARAVFPVAGGAVPLAIASGDGGDAGTLRIRRALFHPADDSFAAVSTAGGALVPVGPELSFTVGADPVPLELLSRRGGELRLEGRIDGGSVPGRLAVLYGGKEQLFEIPGPFLATVPTGLPRARVSLRAVGGTGVMAKVSGVRVALAPGPGASGFLPLE